MELLFNVYYSFFSSGLMQILLPWVESLGSESFSFLGKWYTNEKSWSGRFVLLPVVSSTHRVQSNSQLVVRGLARHRSWSCCPTLALYVERSLSIRENILSDTCQGFTKETVAIVMVWHCYLPNSCEWRSTFQVETWSLIFIFFAFCKKTFSHFFKDYTFLLFCGEAVT